MSRRRINKWAVLVLTMAVSVGLLVTALVVIRQVSRRDPSHFVALAEEAANAGQWRQAGGWYLRARQVSGDAVYLVPFGEMRLREGNLADALGAWTEALVERPDLVPAHRKLLSVRLELADLYRSPEEWREVARAARALLALDDRIPDSDRALAENALGRARIPLRNEDATYAEEGLQALARAAALDPDRAQYGADRAEALLELGRREEALTLLKELVAGHRGGPEAARAEQALAAALATPPSGPETPEAARDRRREADEAFARALVHAGEDAELRGEILASQGRFLARQWTRLRQSGDSTDAAREMFTRAESALREAIAAAPESYDAYLQLATVFRSAARPEDVISVCDKRLALGLDREGLAGPRHRIQTFQLLILASTASVELAVKAIADDRVEDRKKWLDRAREYVARATGEFPNHPRAISQRGRIQLAEGNDRAALADLREAEQRFQSSGQMDPENKVILARLHLRLREPGAARDVLADLVPRARQQGDTPTLLLYARCLLENNEADNPALATLLSEILLADPQQAEARSLEAAMLERQGKVAQAIAVTGEGPQGTLLKAKELALRGDADAAMEVLLEGARTYRDNIRLLAIAGSELLARGRGDEAAALVNQALQAAPEDRSLQRLAVAVRQDLSDEQRRDTFRALLEDEPDGFLRAWSLADLESRSGRFKEALAAIQTARKHLLARDTPSARQATTAQLRALLFTELRLAHEAGDDAAARAACDAARDGNVDGAEGRSLLGLYHMLRGDNEPAILTLTEALQRQRTDVDALTNLGICLQRVGSTEQALDLFRQAVEVNPQAAVAHKALAAIARSRGETQAFREHLAVAARLLPDDPWLREELLLQQEEKEPNKAIERREARRTEAPDDLANLARLSSLYESVGQIEAAADCFRRMLELRPDDRDVVIAAGKFFRRTGQSTEALAITERFVSRCAAGEAQADAQVLVAAHHLAEGQVEEAEQALLAAAQVAPTFEVCRSLGDLYLRAIERPSEALTWLDRAAEIGRARSLPGLRDVLAVRIGCALSHMNDVVLARRLVEEYRRQYGSDPRGWLWLGEVASREGRTEEAIAALSDYLNARSNDAYARYRRASLYEMMGRTAAAMEDLETLKRIDGKAFGQAPRLRLAELYRQAGRDADWLRELESLHADPERSPDAVEALARAYLRVGRVADAEGIVTAEINRGGSSASGRWFLLRGTIALQRGQVEAALADARTAAERDQHRAESLVAGAEVFLRAKRFADGAAWLRPFATREDPRADVLSRWGRLLVSAGEESDGVRVLRQAMNRAVHDSMDLVRIVTGDALLAFGNADGAIEVLARIDPAPSEERANDRLLSRLLHLAGRLTESDQRLERLLRSAEDDGERGDLLAERGDLHQSAERWTEAVAAYEESLRYQPRSWIVLNNLAFALSDRLGEHSRALDYAVQAARLSPNADSLDTLGWVRVQSGQLDAGIAELRRALQFDPRQAITHYHLGEALRRQRRFLEARESLGQARTLAQAQVDDDLLARIARSADRIDRGDATP